MLNYIKEQVRARQPRVEEQPNQSPENVDDEVLLEYASLFQELDDLSVEGTDAGKERKFGVDIPFDDIEVETIEFNLGSGTVADVPGDATASTAITESYQTMKTYDEFFQEAMTQVTRFSRESDDEYNKRVSKVADKMYNEYCEDAKRVGEFGFSTLSVTDESVPSKMLVDFGPVEEGSDKSFMSKVKTFFATDENHRIFKKQLDSIKLVQQGAFQKIGKPLMAYMESHYDVPSGSSVWDICTPKNLIVPKGNGDSFCVVLEYTNELTGKNEYFGWTAPVNEVDENQMNSCTQFNMESFVNETQYENKDTVIQEALVVHDETRRKIRPRSRFYQEAIDFGGADNGGDAGSDLPPAENTGENNDNNAGGDTPPAEGGDNTANADQNVDASSGSDAAPADATSSEGTDDANKETAAVNDVSTQIAEKVADQTQQQADENAPDDMGSDISFPDESSTTDDGSNIDEPPATDDTSSTEPTSDGTTDDFATSEDLGDDTGADFDDDADMPDLENMTIDQIIDQGTEKLKGMTMAEIKDFIGSASPSEIQEAFILTNKNINKELDVRIRDVLGILNSTTDINKLIRKFKFSSHRLNRVLSKASKMTKVYSTDEIELIQKLNTALENLRVVMKTNSKGTSAATIKRNITEFTSACKKVTAFVEEKMTSNKEPEAVQEGFFLSASNVKKRLGKKIAPVLADMKELVDSMDKDRLTKSKLSKMYKGKTRTVTSGSTIGGGDITYGTASTDTYDVMTPAGANMSQLAMIISKIQRKPKIQAAFTGSQLEMITDIGEYLDDFVDLLESILYDTSDSAPLLAQVGDIAKKMLIKLQHAMSFCNETVVNDTTPDPTPTTTSTSDDEEDDVPSLPDDDTDTSDDDDDAPKLPDETDDIDDDDDNDEEDED